MSLASVPKWLLASFGRLESPSRYGVIFGFIFVGWLLIYGIVRALNSKWPKTTSFLLRHLVYPHILPRIPFIGTATPLQFLIVFLYLLGNTLVITIGRKDNISFRAATMSTINLIPLLCGPRLSLVTRLLGVSLRTSIGSHQWLGRTAMAQMLVHVVVVSKKSTPFTWTTNNITGIVAGSTCGLIFFLSIQVVRSVFYEWFLNLHLLLSIVVSIVAWRHVSSRQPSQLFLRIGIGLWTVVTVAHWILFAIRNFVIGRPFATAVTRRLSNDDPSRLSNDPATVLQVDVTVPRPWRVKAGQFVYLSVPKLGKFTGLRGHPFMISWWERDQQGLTISLLVKSRSGFTAELDKLAGGPLLAFIDGPYGARHDFGEYGTIVMFATGIGIAGHIPYIAELVRGYNNCEVKTRHIRLVWEIKERCQEKWVKGWMDKLLDQDTGYVLLSCPTA